LYKKNWQRSKSGYFFLSFLALNDLTISSGHRDVPKGSAMGGVTLIFFIFFFFLMVALEGFEKEPLIIVACCSYWRHGYDMAKQ